MVLQGEILDISQLKGEKGNKVGLILIIVFYGRITLSEDNVLTFVYNNIMQPRVQGDVGEPGLVGPQGNKNNKINI